MCLPRKFNSPYSATSQHLSTLVMADVNDASCSGGQNSGAGGTLSPVGAGTRKRHPRRAAERNLISKEIASEIASK